MRGALAVLLLLPVLACDDGRRASERRAEVERRVAEAEGAAAGREPPPSPAQGAITREPTAEAPPVAEPPSPASAAWASSISRAIDALERRSLQALGVHLLHVHRDPRQKGQELLGEMQWCDEGSLHACLHVGHVLLFNECLFDRARGFYEKASALADALPAPAIDSFTVDGQPQRSELRLGLQYSDPAHRDDAQVRAVAAVCGAAAERDRVPWDGLFARYAAGEAAETASASSGDERVALGAIRKKMVIDLEEQVEALERLSAGAAAPLRERLAAATHDLCGVGDPVSCATASFLYSGRCAFPQMEDAYRRFQSALSGLDPASQARAQEVARDVLGPARAYVEGDDRMRGLLRTSRCRGTN